MTEDEIVAEFNQVRALLPDGTPGEAYLLLWKLERRMVLQAVAAEVLSKHVRERHLRSVGT